MAWYPYAIQLQLEPNTPSPRSIPLQFHIFPYV